MGWLLLIGGALAVDVLRSFLMLTRAGVDSIYQNDSETDLWL